MAGSSRRSPRPGRASGASGFTRTDLHGNAGTRSGEEGAEIVVRMATVGPDGPTGTFTDSDGPLPW